jgi:hypothetical protein
MKRLLSLLVVALALALVGVTRTPPPAPTPKPTPRIDDPRVLVTVRNTTSANVVLSDTTGGSWRLARGETLNIKVLIPTKFHVKGVRFDPWQSCGDFAVFSKPRAVLVIRPIKIKEPNEEEDDSCKITEG